MAVNATGKWLISAVAENVRRGQELEISLQRREEKNQGEATVLLQRWPYGKKQNRRQGRDATGVQEGMGRGVLGEAVEIAGEDSYDLITFANKDTSVRPLVLQFPINSVQGWTNLMVICSVGTPAWASQYQDHGGLLRRSSPVYEPLFIWDISLRHLGGA